MSTSVVVGGIFLSGNDLFRMVELLVGSRTDFVTDGGFQVDVDGARNVLSGRSFTKERVEGIVVLTNRLFRHPRTVTLNAVLQAVQLPALISGLDTGLTQVNRDTFYRARKTRQ